VDQRIPIPLTMWKPLTPEDGVRLNLFGPSTISPIDGQRAAILICYEQLLPLAALQSLYEHPTVLIGIANDYWAKDTYFPNIQSADMQAWGLLFHLPVLTSTNI
jgi:apolipoprotein N-acyltransferase